MTIAVPVPPTPEPDPETLAAAVSRCPSVAGLGGGAAGEVASYLPGRRVGGVRVRAEEVTISVVMRYGSSVERAAAEVRAAVRPLAGGRAVHVRIDDVVSA